MTRLPAYLCLRLHAAHLRMRFVGPVRTLICDACGEFR